MINKIKLNKELLLLLVIITFLTIFFAYLLFNILDMFNPIFTEEESCVLTPQLNHLLTKLEQKYE